MKIPRSHLWNWRPWIVDWIRFKEMDEVVYSGGREGWKSNEENSEMW